MLRPGRNPTRTRPVIEVVFDRGRLENGSVRGEHPAPLDDGWRARGRRRKERPGSSSAGTHMRTEPADVLWQSRKEGLPILARFLVRCPWLAMGKTGSMKSGGVFGRCARGPRSAIKGADDAEGAAVDDVGVDHRGPHVLALARRRAWGERGRTAGIPSRRWAGEC
jgi:hypothetical protein